MGKTAVDIIVHLALLAAATALVLLWNESRDNGRYQFQTGDAAVQRYRGRLAASPQLERTCFGWTPGPARSGHSLKFSLRIQDL
jgi:hypothetical protein